jgi:serine/threonine protein phosphatase PrpC
MFHAFGITHLGLVRKNNEDAFLCCEDLQLLAVADGMGGHSAGEVASHLALEAFEAFMRRTSVARDFSWPYGVDPRLSLNANRVRTAVHLANRRVFRAAEGRDDYTGMGTTLSAVLVCDDSAVVGHVGDSRVYLFHEKTLRQLTRDDSWVAMMLANNPAMDPSEVARHPMRHVLTNVLGAREQVEIQLEECRLHEGDLLLACSDGLHGTIDRHELAALLSREGDLPALADALVRTSVDNGAPDNVTAVLARYGSRR